MKERFTEDEWEMVVAVFADGVDRVSSADPTGDAIEFAQIVEDVVLAKSSSSDPVFREVAGALWSNIKEAGLDSAQLQAPAPPLPPDFYRASQTGLAFEALKGGVRGLFDDGVV